MAALTVVVWQLQTTPLTGEHHRPPQPTDPGVWPTAEPAPTRDSTAEPDALAYADPERITIPQIGVDAPIRPVGVEDDGTVEVPPLDEPMLAGWYERGPSPGEEGPAVVLGHLTTPEPAVFFELSALQPGDTVEVARSDGIVAEFEVDAVEAVRRDSFSADAVYGSVDHAALRLVTCGGPYDTETSEYRDNVIAYASLVSWSEP